MCPPVIAPGNTPSPGNSPVIPVFRRIRFPAVSEVLKYRAVPEFKYEELEAATDSRIAGFVDTRLVILNPENRGEFSARNVALCTCKFGLENPGVLILL